MGLFKTNTHYHVITYYGRNPYYSYSLLMKTLEQHMIFDSLSKAHNYFCDMINIMIPGEINTEDKYDSYSDLVNLLVYDDEDEDEYDLEDTKVIKGLRYDSNGLEMEIVICDGCIPSCNN